MIEQFKNLSDQEIELLREAIPMVTVLIAGADGNIDAKEEAWAKKVAHIRTYNNPETLNDYYKDIADSYEIDVNKYMKFTEGNTEEKTALLSEKLTGLNEIFPKLEPQVAFDLYRSLKSFASHVARASGGILGINSISYAEEQLVGLPMLNEVKNPAEDQPK